MKSKFENLLIVALITAMWLMSLSIYSQNISVKGYIKDTNEEPLIGVTIKLIGSSIGTVSDFDGLFNLTNIPSDAELEISYVGMKSQIVKVNGRSSLEITMYDDTETLDEVVVIGYGTVRKRDLTGATSSVSGNEITKVPVTTAAQAISGKLAGVNVTTSSGAPGAEINILVRGGTSITQDVKPLYIVDGFQMDNGLQNVDINDIESIDVMKDASATAIYGARGSNGVVLITTKSGKEGKTRINYNSYLSFESLSNTLKMLNVEDYVKYQYEYQTLRNQESSWATMFGGNTSDPNFYSNAFGRIENDYRNRQGIDWQNLVFGGNVITQNHNASISGGTSKSNFLVSYNLMNQDGIIAKTGYDKNNLRIKLNHELFKGARFDLSSNLSTTKIEGGGVFDGLKQTALQPPTGGVLFTNEEMIHTDLRDQMMLYESAYDINNPIISQDAVTKLQYRRQASINAGLDIDIPKIKGLVFRTAGSYLWEQIRSDLWDDGRTNDAKTKQGPWGERNNAEKFTWQITNTLSYKTTIADSHSLNAIVGHEIWYTESMKLDNTYLKFPNDNFGLNNVNMAGDHISNSDKQRNGIVSLFGRLMYSYEDKYLVTTTLRGDGSSKFSKGNQWGILPSISGAWRISEEPFIKDNIHFIDNLKLRGGYGITGNCNIDNNMFVTDYQGGKYFIGSAEIPALKPQSTLGNPGLVWEQTKSTSVGLDITLFRNRLNLNIDYYNNTSDNLLIKQSIAKSSGYNDQFQNIGSIQNRGFEFVVNTINLKSKNGFEWRSDLNVSFNKSKVLALYGDPDAWMKVDVGSRMEFIIREGEPLGQFYGYKYGGIYTTNDFNQNANGTYSLKDGVIRKSGLTTAQIASIKPGDIKFEGVTGQKDDAGNPLWSDADRTVIGNAQPKFFGGFNNTFFYKGFDLGIFMVFSYGNDVFNMNTQRYVGPYFANQNASSLMKERFTLIDPSTGKESFNLDRLAELNPNQADRRAIWSLNAANKDNATVEKTDYNIEDGSYLRLSNITLGYTVPKEIIQKSFINNLRLYLTANNIYTLTNYSGFDPDVSSETSFLKRGVDNSAYPKTSSYVVGINLTF